MGLASQEHSQEPNPYLSYTVGDYYILKSTLKRTDSQCRDAKIGIISNLPLDLVSSLAASEPAEVWMGCTDSHRNIESYSNVIWA